MFVNYDEVNILFKFDNHFIRRKILVSAYLI